MVHPLGPAREQDADLVAIREWFSYDTDTGVLAWKKDRGKAKAGNPAGVKTHHGYIQVVFQRRVWPAHKLVWVLHYGVWPDLSIDHIDRDGTNNRIGNLRLATWSQQQANKWVPSQNKTGFKGVSLHKQTGKYHARIRVNGKRMHLGEFDTAEAASEAYKTAAREHYGEYARFEDAA